MQGKAALTGDKVVRLCARRGGTCFSKQETARLKKAPSLNDTGKLRFNGLKRQI